MHRKSARSDQAIAELAERQYGIVSVRQLHDLDIDEHAVLRRQRAGRLHRIHRGVYAVGHVPRSDEARWMAAVLACGSPVERSGSDRDILGHWGAALSHRSAAGLWGLLTAVAGAVDVSVAGDGGRRRRMGIRLHRCSTLLPADVTLRGGIPVTTPARTISDLRRAASHPKRENPISAREVRRAIRQVEVLGLTLAKEGDSDRTRSELERAFLRLCHRHRFPPPEVNVQVGCHLVDFVWRERGLVVETDGYRYHRGRAAFEDDRARDLALRALGYDVMRLSDRQLTEEPERIVGILERRLARFRSHGRETRHTAP